MCGTTYHFAPSIFTVGYSPSHHGGLLYRSQIMISELPAPTWGPSHRSRDAFHTPLRRGVTVAQRTV